MQIVFRSYFCRWENWITNFDVEEHAMRLCLCAAKVLLFFQGLKMHIILGRVSNWLQHFFTLFRTSSSGNTVFVLWETLQVLQKITKGKFAEFVFSKSFHVTKYARELKFSLVAKRKEIFVMFFKQKYFFWTD